MDFFETFKNRFLIFQFFLSPKMGSKNNKSSQEDYDYTWIAVAVIGYIILFILYWIFVFRPVARIENTVNKTAQDVENAVNRLEKTAQDVENTDQKVDAIIGAFEQIIPQLEQVFCNFFPNSPICASISNQGIGIGVNRAIGGTGFKRHK